MLRFAGIFSPLSPAQALISAIPEPTKRGAFNAVSASLQQFAGGASAALVTIALTHLVHKQVPEAAPK